MKSIHAVQPEGCANPEGLLRDGVEIVRPVFDLAKELLIERGLGVLLIVQGFREHL